MLRELVRSRLHGLEVALDVPLSRAEYFAVILVRDLDDMNEGLSGTTLGNEP